ALTNHPDLINDENYYKILELLSIISGSDTFAHQPYDTNITTMIMTIIMNITTMTMNTMNIIITPTI
ncbi:MAG: hypothetical protein ACK55I_23100, partial [bacterium]